MYAYLFRRERSRGQVARRLRGRQGALAQWIMRAAGAALLLFVPALAQAQQLPQGGSVAAGSAHIGTPHNGTLDINQSSNRAVLDWHSFSIGQGGTVNFHQPSSSSATLNRVTGSTPSSIAGTINAPGTVLLVNPNGIAITKSGVINTGSFAASTLDIKNSDFMSGHYKFTGGGSSAGVANAGRINVSDGGFAALLGGHVVNDGTITARLGHVALGSGELITLDLAGDGFLSVGVPTKDLSKLKGADGKPLVSNTGKIIADGGVVELKAATAAGILRDAVNVPGSIQAKSVGVHDGKIVLGGGVGGRVRVAGRITARGSKHSDGGMVKVTGAHIALPGTIDASTTGAGRNGGTVSVIADDNLDFSGLIVAEGGEGGTGGAVETSGAHVHIAGTARVSTLSQNGIAGTWLIDPQDFTIAASGGDMTGAQVAAALASNNFEIQSSSGATSGSGDIYVDDTVGWSANTLTLNATNDIVINAALESSGTAGLALEYGQGAGASGNTATYLVNAPVNLASTGSFSTKLGSDGTTIDYTIITDLGGPGSATGTDLQGINGNLSGNYVLGANIDAATTSSWNSNAGFVPLGTDGAGTPLSYGNGFTGTFDGLGHTISGLTINRSTVGQVGLFGVAGNATIRNVGLIGSVVTGGGISGNGGQVGSLIGWQRGGTVSRAYAVGTTVTSTVYNIGGLVGHEDGGTIDSSYATGMVTGTGANNVGGLVGLETGGSVSQSHATVVVAGDSAVGGLVGWQEGGAINSSNATGDVAGNSGLGGLVGTQNSGTISTSYATGVVTGGGNVGGLVGNQNSGGTIDNSDAAGAVTGSSYNVGGLVGTSSGMINVAHATGTVTGSDANVGGLVGKQGGGTINTAYATGAVTGTGSNSFNVGGLAGSSYGSISQTHATGKVTSSSSNVGGLVGKQAAGTIDNSNATGGVAGDGNVGGLVGLQYSAGTISLASASGAVTGNSYNIGGLVGYQKGGTITDAYAVGSVNGYSNVGGLVGLEEGGAIGNASATGNVVGTASVPASYIFTNAGGLVGFQNGGTITNSHATDDTVTGVVNVGGLVGRQQNGGDISVSYATGTVTSANKHAGGLVGFQVDGAISDSYATGPVTGGYLSVGGLVGLQGVGSTTSSATIDDSYATGAVTGLASALAPDTNGSTTYVGGLVGGQQSDGTINNSYSTGAVTGYGTSDIGGLVGAQLGGTIKNAYATGTVTGSSTSNIGGLIGYNQGGSTTNGYWDTDTSGLSIGVGSGSVSGVTGLTTEEWLTQGPIATGVFDMTNTWVAGYPYPVLKALPYVLVTAAGTQTYGSSTPSATVSGAVDQNGNDATGLVDTSSTTWIGCTTCNVGSAYVIGGVGGTVNAGYQLTYVGTLTIEPKTLTAMLVGFVVKAYDRTAIATLSPDNYSLTGIIGSDAVMLNDPNKGTYSDKHIGLHKTVTVTGLGLLGADAGNYVLDATTVSAPIGIILPPGLFYHHHYGHHSHGRFFHFQSKRWRESWRRPVWSW